MTCHVAQKTVIDTDHDLRITAKEEINSLGQKCTESGPCSACHTVHNAQGDKLWARLLPQTQDPVTSYCESCHREKACAEKKLVGTYTHPVGVDIRLAEDKTAAAGGSSAEVPAGASSATGLPGCRFSIRQERHRLRANWLPALPVIMSTSGCRVKAERDLVKISKGMERIVSFG